MKMSQTKGQLQSKQCRLRQVRAKQKHQVWEKMLQALERQLQLRRPFRRPPLVSLEWATLGVLGQPGQRKTTDPRLEAESSVLVLLVRLEHPLGMIGFQSPLCCLNVCKLRTS
jgi:hypothetical protein